MVISLVEDSVLDCGLTTVGLDNASADDSGRVSYAPNSIQPSLESNIMEDMPYVII